ncbi:hypothetical protein EVAR_33140_1 [Eumeta japonica]|uniref:Uncharacterized protein n=1 Tax=Eumeta variegata TaxID=151549 RepID=A0A4C1YB35_EUMVA|nr:hypothetical protein EVAR_33140_1 [Eumeta japonica]
MGRWSEREIDASQAQCLSRSCLSIARSALSLAHSAQAERDNESCFFAQKINTRKGNENKAIEQEFNATLPTPGPYLRAAYSPKQDLHPTLFEYISACV